MEWYILGIIIWLACATFTAGVFLAQSQRQWPSLADADYKSDRRTGWAVGLMFGPVSVPAAILCSSVLKLGFMNPFKPQKPKE